jgi:hypothetical protein
MYTIYHVVGIKVGCTIAPKRRFRQNRDLYGENIQIEILDELENCSAQFAGDREWEWADAFGYPRGYHYTARWDVRISAEELSANGRKAALVSNLGHASSEVRGHSGIGFENNFWYNKSDKHKKDAIKGSKIGASRGILGMQTTSECPHCGKTGQTAVMGRWHFDNCKFRTPPVVEFID